MSLTHMDLYTEAGVDSPRLPRNFPTLNLEPRFTPRLTDRLIDRRGSTADALLDVRSPRFESTESVRRANLRIERRPSILSTEGLDLSTPRSEALGMPMTLSRGDIRVTEEVLNSPISHRRTQMAGQILGPQAPSISALRRETVRRGTHHGLGASSEHDVTKGVDKELRKFAEQEEERRYKRAMLEESSMDDSFAVLPSVQPLKKEKLAKAKKSPKAVVFDRLMADAIWTVYALGGAFVLGLVLLRIERLIRSLANRQSLVGKFLRALWAWMFSSALAKTQPLRLHVN